MAAPASSYDPDAPKKATNQSVNSSLLALARARGINLSRACENGILRRLAEAEAEAWKRDNATAIDAWNDSAGRRGLPLGRLATRVVAPLIPPRRGRAAPSAAESDHRGRGPSISSSTAC